MVDKVKALSSITIEEAMNKQFQLVDVITKHFDGYEVLNQGDLGVKQPNNQPDTTNKVERVIAEFFNAESCVLVRGAGTGALAATISAVMTEKRKCLLHTSPIYPTTKTTLENFNIDIDKVDFHNHEALYNKLSTNQHDFLIIQTTRQTLEDSYDLNEIIQLCAPLKTPMIVDDNYAVMKIEKIGVEYGADISAFSAFKLLGPEGIGVIVGKREICMKIREKQYSGGSQVQGFEAMEVLRGLVYAPVSLAIQSEVINDVTKRLNNNEISGIKSAIIANSQSKVIIVKFDLPIAKEVLKVAVTLGAAAHPVGAESKYEISPMFYRVSDTFRKMDENAINTMIRINPMRAGSETVLRILNESIKKVMLEVS